MLLWIIFALLASLAVVAVLYPLTVKSALQAPLGLDDAHDLVVYRDQLDEIDRDLARSLISENDAEYARTEILRRILVADDKNTCIHGDEHFYHFSSSSYCSRWIFAIRRAKPPAAAFCFTPN
jgi:cytochrome c-type biogenesis protein CcmI